MSNIPRNRPGLDPAIDSEAWFECQISFTVRAYKVKISLSPKNKDTNPSKSDLCLQVELMILELNHFEKDLECLGRFPLLDTLNFVHPHGQILFFGQLKFLSDPVFFAFYGSY